MNKRRHIGLQQLSSLAASGRTFLGPVKSYKFIVDESTQECALTCSGFRLLESLDLTNAVGQLLNETVQMQNKVYKTGTTTLLFLVCAWSNAALECLSQGIPVSVVVSVMSEGLNSCIKEVKSLQISLHDVLKKTRPKSRHPGRKTGVNAAKTLIEKALEGVDSQQMVTCGPCTSSGMCPPSTTDFKAKPLLEVVEHKSWSPIPRSGFTVESISRRVKLTHSRHFQTHEERSLESLQPSSFKDCAKESIDSFCDWNELGHLAMGLSHGNSHSMKLVRDAARHMCQNAGDLFDHSAGSTYSVYKIVHCCLPGLSLGHSCVDSGYVTLVSSEQASVAMHLQNKALQILVVEGDLTESYRHLGFNTASRTKTLSERIHVFGSDSEDLWTNSALNQIAQSHVNLILVKGNVSVNLMEQCIPSNILIISHVDQNVLQAFCEATGAIPVTYITQMNMCCVGSGACVSVFGSGRLNAVELGHRVAISIKATGIPLVTAVLSTPIMSKMQTMEDQFWTCAYRLHHAIADQKVFLGGGAVELLCLSHLRKLEEQCLKGKGQIWAEQFVNTSSWLATSSFCYKSCVLRAMANCWYQYLSSLMCNTTKCSSELDSRTVVENHLQNLAGCNSPSEYILKEFIEEDYSSINLDFPCAPKENSMTYDNVTAKEEAWRRALDLVLLVLQTDYEILASTSAQKQLVHLEEGTCEFQLL